MAANSATIEATAADWLARCDGGHWSAQDAAISGFRVRFLWELTRPVSADNDETTRIALVEAGIEIEK